MNLSVKTAWLTARHIANLRQDHPNPQIPPRKGPCLTRTAMTTSVDHRTPPCIGRIKLYALRTYTQDHAYI